MLGKKIFGRSHIREVAMKHLNSIDEYYRVRDGQYMLECQRVDIEFCSVVGATSSQVSECDVVMEFF